MHECSFNSIPFIQSLIDLFRLNYISITTITTTAPSFVSSFPHSSHVYFFFRESAVEYSSCGKATFSRVARVCARDNGGPHKFR